MVFIKTTIRTSVILLAATVASCNQEQQDLLGQKKDEAQADDKSKSDENSFRSVLANAVQSELITAGFSTSAASAIATAGSSASLALAESDAPTAILAAISGDVNIFNRDSSAELLSQQASGKITDEQAALGFAVLYEQSAEVSADAVTGSEEKEKMRVSVLNTVFSRFSESLLNEDKSGAGFAKLSKALDSAFAADEDSAGYAASAMLQKAADSGDAAKAATSVVFHVAVMQQRWAPELAVEVVMGGVSAAGKVSKGKLNASALGEAAIKAVIDSGAKFETGGVVGKIFESAVDGMSKAKGLEFLSFATEAVAKADDGETGDFLKASVSTLVKNRENKGVGEAVTASDFSNVIKTVVGKVAASAKEGVLAGAFAAAGAVSSKMAGVRAAVEGVVNDTLSEGDRARVIQAGAAKYDQGVAYVPPTTTTRPSIEAFADGDVAGSDDDDDEGDYNTTVTTTTTTSVGTSGGTASGGTPTGSGGTNTMTAPGGW
jgi:hypothetical protein